MSDITAGGTLRAVTASVSGSVDNVVTTIKLSDAFESGLYEALGRVAVSFGRLEYSMLVVMKRLRQADRKSQGQPPQALDDAVLEDLPIKFEECEKLALSLFSKLITDSSRQSAFVELLRKARSLWENERNDCLHCCWTAATGGFRRAGQLPIEDSRWIMSMKRTPPMQRERELGAVNSFPPGSGDKGCAYLPRARFQTKLQTPPHAK
jgi:hypothetical protein